MPRPEVSVNQNSLIIYYDNGAPSDGPVVKVDEFTLISNAATGLSPLEKVAKVTEIAQKIGDMVHEARQGETPQGRPDVVKVEIVARLALDFGNVGTLTAYKSEFKSDWNPFTETKVERIETTDKVITIETKKTDYPFLEPKEETTINVTDKPDKPKEDAPVAVEKNCSKPDAGTSSDPGNKPDAVKPEDAGNKPDAVKPEDAGSKPKVITPKDEAWVNDELTKQFNDAMSSFATMSFSTSEGAEAYLNYALGKAGLEIKASTTGQGLVSAGPEDPAGVSGQLREKGILDDDLIASVRTEANDKIKEFENAIKTVQRELSEIDKNSPDFYDLFTGAVQRWNEEFCSRFSVNLPDEAARSQVSALDASNGVVAMIVPYGPPQKIGRISPTGLIVRSGLGAPDGDVRAAGVEPGFEATEIVSVFDEDAWKIKA